MVLKWLYEQSTSSRQGVRFIAHEHRHTIRTGVLYSLITIEMCASMYVFNWNYFLISFCYFSETNVKILSEYGKVIFRKWFSSDGDTNIRFWKIEKLINLPYGYDENRQSSSLINNILLFLNLTIKSVQFRFNILQN